MGSSEPAEKTVFNFTIENKWQDDFGKVFHPVDIESWNPNSINIVKHYQKLFHAALVHPLRSTWLITQLLFCTSSNHLGYLFL